MTSQQNAEPIRPEPRTFEDESGFPWIRLGLAVFYAVALWLVFWAALLTTAAQFVFHAFAREESEQLRAFAAGLARYAGQTVGYLTFVHDDRPFPFGPLPPA